MLDARLREVQLIDSKRPSSFGRLLHAVRSAVDDDPRVPPPLKELASPVLRAVKEAHDERNRLAHDYWVQIPGQHHRAHSGSRKDSRELVELTALAVNLKDLLFRVRGLWIITPAWFETGVEPELTALDLHDWTRIIQGGIHPDTKAVTATEGPAVLPPGWAVGLELSGASDLAVRSVARMLLPPSDI